MTATVVDNEEDEIYSIAMMIFQLLRKESQQYADNIINNNPLLRLRIVDNVNKQIREIFPHASDDTIKKSKAYLAAFVNKD